MRRFRPYTVGLAFSILFHIPFFYFYLYSAKTPRTPDLILEPIIVECAMELEKARSLHSFLKPPPMSEPPNGF